MLMLNASYDKGGGLEATRKQRSSLLAKLDDRFAQILAKSAEYKHERLYVPSSGKSLGTVRLDVANKKMHEAHTCERCFRLIQNLNILGSIKIVVVEGGAKGINCFV